MEYSESVDWINQPFEGYVVNADFSDQNEVVLENLIDDLRSQFGDAIFCMPRHALHITLFDWIAPLVDYDGQDKETLFKQIYPLYDEALTSILSVKNNIKISFDEIRISPSTIYIVGQDTGEFQEIRNAFIDSIELLPHTKRPPQIIHSSLARFTKPVALESVRSFVGSKTIDIVQDVEKFRLVHTKREPMLEYETLKYYELK